MIAGPFEEASPSPQADAVKASAFPSVVIRVAAAGALGAALAPLGHPGTAVVAAVVAGALVLLSVIDVRQRVLPNRIVLPTAAFALAGHVASAPERAGEWMVACAATALALLVLYVLSRGGLGMGDVKLGLVIGASVGKGAMLALTVGFVLAPFYAVFLLATHGRAARSMTMPLGPFLAAGTLVALIAEAPWRALFG